MSDMFRLSYSVRMMAESEAEVSLYGEIISDMPDWARWSKEDKSAADFKKAIDKVRESGADKLLLRINSPGGSCTEAVAMRSILANAGFSDITIRIEGMCASAATTVATIPGAKVQISEGSEYMIHNPWTIGVGNADEFEHVVERLRNIEDMTRSFYAKKTGQTDDQIKEWMDAETWFTAKQAVEYGFADELIGEEAAIAACVTSKEMMTMKSMYRSVPETILTTISAEDITAEVITVSNGTQNAGGPSEIQEKEKDPMELKDLTVDMLREGNPALYDEIRQSAVEDERVRLADIDALTIPGYEEMAAQAKAEGTSAMDFQKQIVAAMKKKGTEFMAARAAETAPEKEVAGDVPTAKTEEQEIKESAAQIAEFAKNITSAGEGMF